MPLRVRHVAEPLGALRTALANPGLRALQVASLGWSAADATYLVGLLVLAWAEAGAFGVAVANGVRTLPSVLLAPAVTAVHRGHPEQLMRLLLVARAVSLGVALAALALDLPLAAVLLAVAVDSVAATVLRPVRGALVPAVARDPAELVVGNVATTTGESLANLVGPGAAALLLVIGGPAWTFAAALALLAWAGAAAWTVRPTRMGSTTGPRTDDRMQGGRAPRGEDAQRWSRAASALRRMAGSPAVPVVATFVAQRFVRGMFTVLLVGAALELLELGEPGVGLATAAAGLGGVVGGILGVSVVSRHLAGATAAGLALWGMGILLPAVIPVATLALVGFAIGGAAKVAFDVGSFSLLQRAVPNRERGRLLGVMESLVTAALALGGLAASWLVATVGIGASLGIAGGSLVALAVIALPALRRADATAVIPTAALDRLRGVPMFAPLGLATLEELAEAMTEVPVHAGDAVIRQGAPGAAFYIVDAGTFEVTIDGVRRRVLEAGDWFGEIALVREIPRTSTVRAVAAGRVLEIDGAAFRAIVSGDGASAAAVEAVIRDRLATAG